jgi:Kef-type K+ transport system membrane component KefB
MFEPFGRMVTGALLLQDLLMIVWIVMLARFGEPDAKLAQSVGALVGLGALAVICQARLMPWLLLRLRSRDGKRPRVEPGVQPWLDEESLLLVLLAVLFLFAGGAYFLGLHPVVGAFFAGFSLSSFPLNGVVRSVLGSLSDFFLAVFFTALGALITIPEPDLLLRAFALALMVILLTPPLVTIVAEASGLSSRSAIESGLLLAQTSELSLVLALTGEIAGHISRELFSAIALIAVVTMTVTPLVANDRSVRWLLKFHPLRRRLPTQSGHENHVLILGFGAGGMWVVKPLQKAGHDLLVIDDDPAVIIQLEKLGIPCLRGDGADEKILQKANAAKAKLILASMRRVQDTAKLLALVKDIPVVVRMFEDRDAQAIQALGGIPILNSQAATETFMEWFSKHGLAGKDGRDSLRV